MQLIIILEGGGWVWVNYIIYGFYLLSLLLIRDSLWVFELYQLIYYYYHDSWKEPKKLQKEGSKEEDVSFRHSSARQYSILNIVPTPSLGKNGTTSMCPLSSTTAFPLSPPATRLPVKVRITCLLIDCSSVEIAADSLKGRVFEVSLADLNRESND